MSEDAQASLHESFVLLSQRWDDARSVWRDGVAARFEREFWDEIVQVTRALERSAAEVSSVLNQALRRTES